MEVNVNIHNRFDIEVRDSLTGELKTSAKAYNIILNVAWNRIVALSAFFTQISFGTGTGTPVPTRTSLFNYLGEKTATQVELVLALPTSYCKKSIVLNPEEYVGRVITEVGIAGASALNTHAMLQDSEGNQITIAKTATDVVTIYATVFATFIDDPNVPLINIANNQLLKHACGANTTSMPLSSSAVGVSDAPYKPWMVELGKSLTTSATNIASIDVANKRVTFAPARFGTAYANDHIKEVLFAGLARAVLPVAGVSPPVRYTDVPVASGDGVSTQFRLPSKNIDISSLVIKVNNNVVSNFTSKRKRSANYLATTNYDPGGSGNSDTMLFKVANSDSWCSKWVSSTQYGKHSNEIIRQTNLWKSDTDPFKGSINTSPYLWASSPTDQLLAVPFYNAPYVKLFDIGVVPPIHDDRYSFDIAPASSPLYMTFTPDGMYLIMAMSGGKMLRYKKNGYVFEKLPEIPGEPNLFVGNMYGLLAAYGDLIIVRCVLTSTQHGIVVYKRTGDSFTFVTPADYIQIGLSAFLNSTRTMLYIPDSSRAVVYAIDTAGGLTRQADMPLASSVTVRGAYLFEDDFFVTFLASSPYLVMYELTSDTTCKRLEPNNAVLTGTPGDLMHSCLLTEDCILLSARDNVYSIDFSKRYVDITFDTPPAVGAAITATYDVNGIHKTDQYVIDVQTSIQFGEAT